MGLSTTASTSISTSTSQPSIESRGTTTAHTQTHTRVEDKDTASNTQTTAESSSTNTQDTYTHTRMLAQAALDSDEVVNEEEEEDLSDLAVAARHEGMLKKMRDRWALLQRLRMERKHALLGVPFQWVEGECGCWMLSDGHSVCVFYLRLNL